MPTILFTVTNDLSYDQRMQRICASLVRHGYSVELVGRELPDAVALEERPYRQRRLPCRFRKGFLFYAEFNARLFGYLMQAEYDAVCSIDLDTLPAGCAATLLRRKKRVFDAHEYFTEVPEVTGRPFVKLFWSLVARLCLPFYRYAYTVGPALAALFEKKYGLPFAVVRNSPPHERVASASDLVQGKRTEQAGDGGKQVVPTDEERGAERFSPPPGGARGGLILLYQGALNEARGIEALLEAMRQLEDFQLWLAGEGDLSERLRQLAAGLGVQDRVHFLGRVRPGELQAVTRQAWLGLNVLENKGLSYYYSLANKFFDYVQAGVPVLTMNFPEYRALNAEREVAVLLDQLTPDAVVQAVRYLQMHPEVWERLHQNTLIAREQWNWEREETALRGVWEQVFAS